MSQIFSWFTTQLTENTLNLVFWLGLAFFLGWILSSKEILPKIG